MCGASALVRVSRRGDVFEHRPVPEDCQRYVVPNILWQQCALCFPRRDQRLGWAPSFQRRSGSSPIPIASELCHLAVMCFSCALPSLSCTRLSPFLDKRRVPLAVVLFSPLGEEIGSRLWRVARFCCLRGAWKRGVFLGRCQESRSELAPDQGGRAVTVVVCQNFGDKMGVCLSKFS